MGRVDTYLSNGVFVLFAASSPHVDIGQIDTWILRNAGEHCESAAVTESVENRS